MTDTTARIIEILGQAPIIPVLAIDDLADAEPLAIALRDGGLTVIEITLRTAVALDAIKLIKANVPGVIVGSGTVVNLGQVDQSIAAGVEFIVTPGFSRPLVDRIIGSGIPVLPGVTTPTEIIAGYDAGLSVFKFFPAETSGGIAALKAFHGPFAQASFCPTGGIRPSNIADYLSLANVRCVGGMWMAPADLVAAKNWTAITDLSRAAHSAGVAALASPPNN